MAADGGTPCLCHHPAETPPRQRGGRPSLQLRWEWSHQSRLRAPLPPRCLASACRGEPAACGSWRAPAWPGGHTRGVRPQGCWHQAGTALGASVPAGLVPSGTQWTVLMGPGLPGHWHGSGRRHLSGAGHSSLSGSAVASSSVAPAVPGGKAVLEHPQPAIPHAFPALCPSRPKSSGTRGLTGWAGLWR